MNSVDPLYAKIADEWMKTIIEDFGTDHWYQLDVACRRMAPRRKRLSRQCSHVAAPTLRRGAP